MSEFELHQTELTSPVSAEEALINVLKDAYYNDRLVRGFKQTIKALEKEQAQLCLLSDSCDLKACVELAEKLCKEKSIQLVRVSNGKKLGEWTNLHGRGCSFAAVKNSEELASESMQILMESLRNSNE